MPVTPIIIAFAFCKVINVSFSTTDRKQSVKRSDFGAKRVYLDLSAFLNHHGTIVWLTWSTNAFFSALFSHTCILHAIRLRSIRYVASWFGSPAIHCRKAFEWNQLVWNKFQFKYPNKTNLEPAQCERSSILGSMPNPAVGGGDRRVSRPHQVQSWHAGPRWRSPSCLKRSDNCL